METNFTITFECGIDMTNVGSNLVDNLVETAREEAGINFIEEDSLPRFFYEEAIKAFVAELKNRDLI